MGEDKKMKIVFEEGAFDGFEGTQEELDEFVAELKRMVESGEIFEKSVPIEELDEETRMRIEADVSERSKRTLN